MLNWLVGLLLFNFVKTESFEWTEWTRFSACSVTCGQGTRVAKRECVVVETPKNETGENLCYGPAEQTSPCSLLGCPKVVVNPCNCGCKLKKKSDSFSSRMSYKKPFDCHWYINAEPGFGVKITIHELKIRNGDVFLMGANDFNKLVKSTTSLPYTATLHGNVVNISLHSYYGEGEGNVEFDVSYETFEVGDKPGESKLNIPAIAGISACIFVIIIASCIICYKRYSRKSNEDEKNESSNEENDDAYSSASSSTRNSNSKAKAQLRSPSSNVSEPIHEHQKLLHYIPQRGFSENGESDVFMQQQQPFMMAPATYWVPSTQAGQMYPHNQVHMVNPAQFNNATAPPQRV